MAKEKENLAGKGEYDDLLFEAPAEAVTMGESFVYRSGPSQRDGGNGRPGVGEDKEGKPQAHCGWLPIQGILAERVWRDSPKFDKEGFHQFVVLLTKPALGIAEDKHVRLKPGQFICFTESGALRELARYASHPQMTAEVYVRPTGATKATPNGPMKVWECKRVRLLERKGINLTMLPELPEDGLPPELRGDLAKPMLPARQ